VSTPLALPQARVQRSRVLQEISQRLKERSQSLSDAIRQRELYFRISVVGTCNLSCTFCHNEGAPTRGKITLESVETALAAAVRVGFTRVQFTGGEPLLRPDIADFVKVARTYLSDVGVTTNGTFLPKRLDALVASGLHRLHVSLQTEPLHEAGTDGEWGIPDWLLPTVERAAEGSFIVRFNLPVPADSLTKADSFLGLLTGKGIDVKVFSVLPEGDERDSDYPISELEAIVDSVNMRNSRIADRVTGHVYLRGFRPPTGLRCAQCRDISRCKEQSHSLRLGADLQLRPCLATRDWDSHLEGSDIEESIRTAALLALDYIW
jgi:GTP 3',8-cyclase